MPGWARRAERPERPFEGRRKRNGVRFSVQRLWCGCERRKWVKPNHLRS